MMNLATNGFMANNDYFTVAHNFVTNKTTVALNYENYSFKIITDCEMEYNTVGWTGTSYSKNILKSINQVLGNYTIEKFVILLCSELNDATQLGSTGAYQHR